MQTYEILVRNRAIVGNSNDMTLVRTSVGIDQVHVLFDNDEWLAFPITITFAQGGDMVTQALVVSETPDSEWVAESTVTVPHEVTDMTGPIRVTLQGTDASGNHIITAKGSPLTVEEAGDVLLGEVPSDAPTVDQWQQAYADAMAAVNQAASLVSNLRDQLDAMVSDATAALDERINAGVSPATTESIGGVIVGDGLDITEDGVLSTKTTEATGQGAGLTTAQASALVNLTMLAAYAFDTTFSDSGLLNDDVKVKTSALPRASGSALGIVIPDGTTVFAGENGVLRAKQYELPTATESALGGVMPDGTTIENVNGVISARVATTEVTGVVRPDGTTITVAADGTITASGGGSDGGYILPKATDTQLGGVKVDGTTIVASEDGVISVAFVNADEEVY